jgi:hypothetical protein
MRRNRADTESATADVSRESPGERRATVGIRRENTDRRNLTKRLSENVAATILVASDAASCRQPSNQPAAGSR